MSEYTPDLWKIASVTTKEGERTDKVFGCWYGGYAGSDSWKLSSGITKITEHDTYYEVENISGSTYICYKGAEGMSGYGSSVYNRLTEQLKDIHATMHEITIDNVVPIHHYEVTTHDKQQEWLKNVRKTEY